MAVTNMIPEIWHARLIDRFRRQSVWLPLVYDVSDDIADSGDQVHLGTLSSNVTIRDYMPGTAIQTEDFDTSAATLMLNQRKYFAVIFEDLDQAQTRPNIIDRGMANAARGMQLEVNDHIREQIDNGLPGGRVSASVDRNPADATYRAALVDAILDVSEKADGEGWPEEGRYMVLSPGDKRQLVEYLTVDKPGLGGGSLVDEAYQNAAIGRTLGFRPVVDAGIPVAGTNGHANYFGVANEGLAFAMGVNEVEGMRSEAHFGDLLRGLVNYGAQRIDASFFYVVRKTFA